MNEYEKALLDYGEKRWLWKYSKGIAMTNAKSFSWLFNSYFDSEKTNMRDAYVSYRAKNDFELLDRIKNAWNARCKVMKLRKELGIYE